MAEHAENVHKLPPFDPKEPWESFKPIYIASCHGLPLPYPLEEISDLTKAHPELIGRYWPILAEEFNTQVVHVIDFVKNAPDYAVSLADVFLDIPGHPDVPDLLPIYSGLAWMLGKLPKTDQVDQQLSDTRISATTDPQAVWAHLETNAQTFAKITGKIDKTTNLAVVADSFMGDPNIQVTAALGSNLGHNDSLIIRAIPANPKEYDFCLPNDIQILSNGVIRIPNGYTPVKDIGYLLKRTKDLDEIALVGAMSKHDFNSPELKAVLDQDIGLFECIVRNSFFDRKKR
jgi:hypothetical protein